MIRKVYEGMIIIGDVVEGYVEYFQDDCDPNIKYVMSIQTFDRLPDAPAW